jgi:hypothetical protein
MKALLAAFIAGASIYAGWPLPSPKDEPLFAAAPPEETFHPATSALSMKTTIPEQNISGEETLEVAVNQWKAALGKQKGFEIFQTASWTSYPLGPGTHGWIIILQQNSSEVGYMVIHAAPDKTYRLGEYGTGKSPLYSLATLYRSLVQHGLIDMSYAAFSQTNGLHGERLYYNPMQAVWKISIQSRIYLIDAKTGELLPVHESFLPQQSETAESETVISGIAKAQSPLHLIEKLELPAFDPYEKLPWVKGKPLEIQSFADLKKQLDGKQKMTYVAFLYGYEVTVPLAVTGYHLWTTNGYVLLDQDGMRAVDFEELPSSARFYR